MEKGSKKYQKEEAKVKDMSRELQSVSRKKPKSGNLKLGSDETGVDVCDDACVWYDRVNCFVDLRGPERRRAAIWADLVFQVVRAKRTHQPEANWLQLHLHRKQNPLSECLFNPFSVHFVDDVCQTADSKDARLRSFAGGLEALQRWNAASFVYWRKEYLRLRSLLIFLFLRKFKKSAFSENRKKIF